MEVSELAQSATEREIICAIFHLVPSFLFSFTRSLLQSHTDLLPSNSPSEFPSSPGGVGKCYLRSAKIPFLLLFKYIDVERERGKKSHSGPLVMCAPPHWKAEVEREHGGGSGPLAECLLTG